VTSISLSEKVAGTTSWTSPHGEIAAGYMSISLVLATPGIFEVR
jgi:hypothetical protein